MSPTVPETSVPVTISGFAVITNENAHGWEEELNSERHGQGEGVGATQNEDYRLKKVDKIT